MISVTGSSGSRGLKLVWEKGKAGTADLQCRLFFCVTNITSEDTNPI